ncbi:hypothetical protein [Mycoplasma sp. HU2014]|uniref:hypothetical protein n=1 Tax=Mycoplasma sp. HU2014 TaxID=1664275 RepID=UPI00067DF49B|nr:hypothetical protein [Mycoplasma sp. HU2014]MBY7703977.1 hypothetical protein [Vibrio harveyi]
MKNKIYLKKKKEAIVKSIQENIQIIDESVKAQANEEAKKEYKEKVAKALEDYNKEIAKVKDLKYYKKVDEHFFIFDCFYILIDIPDAFIY